MTILEVSNLTIRFGDRTILNGLDFSVRAGERVGLIGESGSGKSLTCMAVLGLLPAGARVAGSIRFEGRELIGAGDRAHRALRGNRMSCVFQEPQSALDPLQRIGVQMTSSVRARRKLSRTEATTIAVALATEVGLPNPEVFIRRYPHELSGGQRQRVVIAMAMASLPTLVLADEPTTALDATVQARILELLGGKVTTAGSALILVTHDMAVAAATCDRLIVMKTGRIVEQGSTVDVLEIPRHAYTRELVDSAYATSWTDGRNCSAAA